ncbi:PstA family ABC transporter permease [Desulfatitalea alkaliphila]|uniref:ABC transporter permease subunit n=1 Tax=Desulfatitalea alkaliphila TaxID=2929485 RepID=A0AA41QZU8_9BACT|nr:ABC transporter permease subunit [Desulfatitalea alkaliphila]MCJ8499254.1 ABC transporter permease subunit [Desulfatitalea alkaliphila]
MRPTANRRTSDLATTIFCWTAAVLTMLAVLAVMGFLLYRGAGTLGPNLFFGETHWWEAVRGVRPVFDGLWSALAGTALLVLLSCLLAVPTGIAGGIYLSEYGSRRFRAVAGFAVDLMAGIPSIVMGLFGFSLIVVLRHTFVPRAKTGLLLAAVCIALLVLPYLVRTTQNALAGLPSHLRLLGPSLGFTPWQNIRHVLLPSAGRGILSGVILAMGRAAEDTAVILLTGAVAQAFLPRSLYDKFEALPFRIYYMAAEHRTAAELDQAFGTALVLLMLTGTLFGLAFAAQRTMEKRWKG